MSNLFDDVARIAKQPKPSMIELPEPFASFWQQVAQQRDRHRLRQAQHERALQDSEDARIKRETRRQERSR